MSERYSRVRADLVSAVQSILDSPELLDVTFSVGMGSATRQMAANATMLAIRSPYFRAMCFGPLRSPETVKVLPDVDPSAFEKVLGFVHASDNCLQLDSLEQAWAVRYAANQFLMPDLKEIADEYISSKLIFRNGITLLMQSRTFLAEDVRRRALRCLRNRHAHVLDSAHLQQLHPDDLIDLIRMFRAAGKASTDSIVKAILRWGSGREKPDLVSLLTSVFPLLDWSTVGRKTVLAIHDAGLLQIQQENDIMVEFLKRDTSDEESKPDDSAVECRLFLVNQNEGPRSVSRIVLRTLDCYRRTGVSTKGDWVILDSAGADAFDKIEREKMPGYSVDRDDVVVRMDGNDRRRVEDVEAIAYPFRSNQKIYYFVDVRFHSPVVLPAHQDGASERMVIELAPELFKDLRDQVLLEHKGKSDSVQRSRTPSTSSLGRYSESSNVWVFGWRSFVGDKEVIASDDVGTKFFYEDQDVSIVCKIQF